VFDAGTSRAFGALVGTAASRTLAVSAVTGLAAGTALLTTAIVSIGSALLWP
jgi:hypothetical protein